jgi:alkylation response protein AidB-like acyl-CoA dehydrogenase
VNEVFFTDVRVPVANLVGAENEGWTIAKYLLGHERTNIAGVGFSLQALAQVKSLARTVRRGGKPLIQNTLFAARIAAGRGRAGGDEDHQPADARPRGGGRHARRRALHAQDQGHADPADDQRSGPPRVGPAAAPFPSEDLEGNLRVAPAGHANDTASYFNNRKISIYGGSNEIQRNILAKGLSAR